MITDYIAQVDYHQHERELAESVERRRQAGERAAQQLKGGRLELIAQLARQARTTRVTTGHPHLA